MKINGNIANLFYVFGICDTDGINSCNRYLGRLHELKLELEDAMLECENEIRKIEQERRPF